MVTIFFIHLICVCLFLVLAFRAPVREDFHDSRCEWPGTNTRAARTPSVMGGGLFGRSRSYPGQP